MEFACKKFHILLNQNKIILSSISYKLMIINIDYIWFFFQTHLTKTYHHSTSNTKKNHTTKTNTSKPHFNRFNPQYLNNPKHIPRFTRFSWTGAFFSRRRRRRVRAAKSPFAVGQALWLLLRLARTSHISR